VSRIAGVVLAAGMSRRLGRPKQLLVLDGLPLVAHVVDRALTSSLDDVVVVTGARMKDVQVALVGRSVRFVQNARFEEGQGTSLAAGISALPADVDAAVILLGDQPGISAATIDRVTAAYRERGAPVVMAQYGEQRGHPVLFGRETFPELMALGGDMGGREVVRSYRDQLVLVDGGVDAPPSDVDTEEAWIELQRSWLERR
jgi:molybdenum cofactor cytidylyltransferase